ncbi:profilin-1A [Procambarus clarkii]|uniref:Profilin n=1 Tax=Procambarus clarkii TaxID=6728 RepID=A0A3G0Z6G9_PROCL|nr:profilin-1A-like [Procambarus clarkii]XP_045597782.1 profilin-1A-like [Procambarus clarkii]AIE17744.1 profilin [Procambarus clarkii]
MSWNTYVENLENTSGVTKAAIYGLDGSPWAASQGWTATPKQIQDIVKAFADPSSLRASGIWLGEDKYFFLSSDSEVMRGKKGQNGVHICKTKSAIIIGYYEDPIQPGQCAKEVENVAEYLKGQNY